MRPLEKAVVELVRLGLNGDSISVQQYARRLLRSDAAHENSELRSRLASLLVGRGRTGSVTRASPTQVGQAVDSIGSLLREVGVPGVLPPILADNEWRVLEAIIEEQEAAEVLLDAGVEPTKTILLTGPPGVGKTHTARFLANVLEIPLLEVDLASAISSYLGETGQNLQRILDHAKGRRCLLFLDEFDALAKRRDDQSDVGELKRIVNVLLLELDDWLPTGLLVAATNHSELLDKAVWRRFDRVLELGEPDRSARAGILRHYLDSFEQQVEDPEELVLAVAAITGGATGADLERLVRNAVRTSLVRNDRSLSEELVTEAANWLTDGSFGDDQRKSKQQMFARVATSQLGLSNRAVGRLLDISHVTVGRWLERAS